MKTPEQWIDTAYSLLGGTIAGLIALGVIIAGLNQPPVEADSLANPAEIEFVKNGG